MATTKGEYWNTDPNTGWTTPPTGGSAGFKPTEIGDLNKIEGWQDLDRDWQGKGFWMGGIGANEERWPNPFQGASADLRDSMNEAKWWENPHIPGSWMGQWAYEGATPGIEYGLPQAYQNLGGLIGQRGAMDPGGVNQNIRDVGQQAMMDQHSLQAQLADAGMQGSEMGVAQGQAIDAGRLGAQAGAYGNFQNQQEAQYRDDLQQAYAMLMGWPMQLYDTAAGIQTGQWDRSLAQGDRDMQNYAAIMNMVGGAAGADWSSLFGGGQDKSQLSQQELENLQMSVGTGF